MNRLISVLILLELIAAWESSAPLQHALFLHFMVWRSLRSRFTWTIVPFWKAQPSVFVFFSLKHYGAVFLLFL